MPQSNQFLSEFIEGTTYRIRVGKGHPDVPGLYPHQLDSLAKLEESSSVKVPPVSGIVHLPTGAGKTRIGIEHIARALKASPRQQFIWSTESRGLIQQTMRKVIEYAGLFPEGVRMIWHDGSKDLLAGDDYQIVFITRRRLTTELERMHDQRWNHLWRDWILDRHPLTLIYDECHQLGAEQLQDAWWKLDEKVFESGRIRSHRWRVIGLSATPLPTNRRSHDLLKQVVFPVRPEANSVEGTWGMHVFHRVSNQELLEQGILCPVNTDIDSRGEFDVPEDLLGRLLNEKNLRPPEPSASRTELYEYALRFNAEVMGHPEVLGFFANRLGQYLDLLGKTIVFVPNIQAANRLVGLLSKQKRLEGKVAVVHSRLEELDSVLPSQQERSPEQVLAAFSARGQEPCILVNVEMLTEGFDDPKVQTVVLGKLTLSTNRFWQMIGRGTRGPRSGGTQWCNVIDPIKLVRLYDFTEGYQPSVEKKCTLIGEDDSTELGEGSLEPWVQHIKCPPLPSKATYKVDPAIRAELEEVARTIDQFLGGWLTQDDALVQMSEATRIDYQDGSPVIRLGPDPDHGVGQMILRESAERLRKQLDAELIWLEARLPQCPDSEELRKGLRRMRAVGKLQLRTDREYEAAERSGDLAKSADQPQTNDDNQNSPNLQALSSSLRPTANAAPITLDLARVCAALAKVDGDLDPREVASAAHLLVDFYGVNDSTELRRSVETAPPGDVAGILRKVVGQSDVALKRKVMKGLVRLAFADQRLHEAERDLLSSWSAVLDLNQEYLQGLLDQ
jgi:superfamily II DNA or RNA helicase